MSIVVFIFLGLIAGYVALGLFKSTGKSAMFDFGLGVTGAVIAGSLFNHIAAGLTIASALVALTGAAVLLAASHVMFRDTRYRRRDPI